MDPSYQNNYYNLTDSQDYTPTSFPENSSFFPNLTQDLVTQGPQSSLQSGKESSTKKWDVAEDIALMSAWCIISENKTVGKNQRKDALWAQVKKLYDESQEENPQVIRKRNVDQMRGRFKRLNESVNKWVAAYREAYRQMKSGMSLKDVENNAHTIYEQERGCKFHDFVVFDKVMSKSPKWGLEINHDTTRSRHESELGNEESGGSSKRSRTTEEGDYCVNSNQETPTSGGSSIKRPTGRDGAKKKGKGKAESELAEELRELRLARSNELDLMRKRLDFDEKKERQKQERELQKMQLLHLNTLLGKQYLSPEEIEMKGNLMAKFYGN